MNLNRLDRVLKIDHFGEDSYGNSLPTKAVDSMPGQNEDRKVEQVTCFYLAITFQLCPQVLFLP